MAYGIVHQFAGGTEEQYRASIAAVHPSDGSLPEDQVLHIAGPTADGWVIVAIHASRESWEKFRDGTLNASHAGGDRGWVRGAATGDVVARRWSGGVYARWWLSLPIRQRQRHALLESHASTGILLYDSEQVRLAL